MLTETHWHLSEDYFTEIAQDITNYKVFEKYIFGNIATSAGNKALHRINVLMR